MSISVVRSVALSVGLCLVLGAGAGSNATEKIPPDKVVHPILKPVSEPEVIPESRKEPVYPEKWRNLHLGGRVILQGVVEKSGSVSGIVPLMVGLRAEADCEKRPVGEEAKKTGDQAAPPEASRDFEAAAIAAVKQWKYRPGMTQGIPVDVYYTMVVEFSPCPKKTDSGNPAKP